MNGFSSAWECFEVLPTSSSASPLDHHGQRWDSAFPICNANSCLLMAVQPFSEDGRTSFVAWAKFIGSVLKGWDEFILS